MSGSRWIKLIVPVGGFVLAAATVAVNRPAKTASVHPSATPAVLLGSGDEALTPMPNPDIKVNGRSIQVGQDGQAHILVPDGAVDVSAGPGHTHVSAQVQTPSGAAGNNLDLSVQTVTVNGRTVTRTNERSTNTTQLRHNVSSTTVSSSSTATSR
jgi:hypothetical protein